jgi:UDP-N-acetylmuramoyl-tripeptide--D-alanyl-D-alanine ligase
MFPIGIEKFADLFTGEQMLLYVIMCVVNAVILFYCSIKFILVLQQCGYRGKRYFTWLGNKDTPYMSRLMLLVLSSVLFFCVLNMTFEPVFSPNFDSYFGFMAYLLFTIVYINSESHVNAKVPLKITKRLIRLCITFGIMLAVVTFGFIVLFNYIAYIIGNEVFALLRYAFICAIPLLLPYILFISYCINEPMEYVIRKHYIRIAQNKLDNSKVVKIGITGSYGKTSVKEILRTILSQKFRVLATPASYNTPLGIALTARHLDSTHDVFIAEMGARQKGDIKELVKLVKPKYGVLTGINNQHLESFGTEENIINTKNELFEYMPEGGIGIFSCDNQNSLALYERFEGEKSFAGITDQNGLVTATEIKTDSKGMTFKLKIKGEQEIECSTILLGTHSVKNICIAAAVAYKLGLTPEEIAQGINRIQSIGHRLELLPNNKNIVIIDDSYNSNVDGFSSAMEVLDTFEGRKIVLTPGLVELGKVENVVNFELGKKLAKHANKVIVIGKHNAEMIINGLIDGGMSREDIKFAKSFNKGNAILNEMMQAGDVVLFENDLPDNYN